LFLIIKRENEGNKRLETNKRRSLRKEEDLTAAFKEVREMKEGKIPNPLLDFPE
jgi:hypothetical protein